VTVSSNNHKAARMRFDDLQGERRYSRWGAYGQSKLANLLFAFEIDRRLRAGGRPLISVAAHAGYSATNLQLSAPPPVCPVG
jgi:NAD(P)-dependent dehydrogenase (short-subunit alcohol dehydrogenase family)